jgi:hypothetical protein
MSRGRDWGRQLGTEEHEGWEPDVTLHGMIQRAAKGREEGARGD